jgi:hypothetical protein
MHHPSFTWMVQQQYVARLAAVQQVSSGNPNNTWTVQRRNTVARLATIQQRLEPNDGAWFMHDASFQGCLYSLLGTTFWSGTHDFSLGGAHRFSALCLRVAIAILTCMSVGERGRNGRSGNEHSLAYNVRFAIKACHAAAKVMRGSLAAGIASTEEEGQRFEELERRDVLSSYP